MTKVNIEEIQAALKVINDFDDLDLTELELYKDGVLQEISPKMLEEWKFVGLCNSDFIAMELWDKATIYEDVLPYG